MSWSCAFVSRMRSACGRRICLGWRIRRWRRCRRYGTRGVGARMRRVVIGVADRRAGRGSWRCLSSRLIGTLDGKERGVAIVRRSPDRGDTRRRIRGRRGPAGHHSAECRHHIAGRRLGPARYGRRMTDEGSPMSAPSLGARSAGAGRSRSSSSVVAVLSVVDVAVGVRRGMPGERPADAVAYVLVVAGSVSWCGVVGRRSSCSRA